MCLSRCWSAPENEEEGTVPAGQVDTRREEMRGRGGTGPYGKGEKGAGVITTWGWGGGGGSEGFGVGYRTQQPASQPASHHHKPKCLRYNLGATIPAQIKGEGRRLEDK